MSNELPDCLLVGTKRAGTTYLRGYFEAHPGIIWSRGATYFVDEQAFGKRGYKDYLADLAPPVKKEDSGNVWIDVSEFVSVGRFVNDIEQWRANRFNPDYQFSGEHFYFDPEKAAQRVGKTIPEAKIILTVRNQIDWLQTHYRVFWRELPKGRNSFYDFIETPEGQLAINGCYYDRILESYLVHYNQDNIFVLILEELARSPETVQRELCSFLGIPFHFYEPPAGKRNQSGGNASYFLEKKLGFGLLPAYLKNGIKKGIHVMPGFVKTGLLSLLSGRSLVNEREINVMKSMYGLSNHRLGQMLGRDLAEFNYPV